MDTKPLGGSIPLVELEICEELSQGIRAVKVEFLRPLDTISFRNLSQFNSSLVPQNLSISFL